MTSSPLIERLRCSCGAKLCATPCSSGHFPHHTIIRKIVTGDIGDCHQYDHCNARCIPPFAELRAKATSND